MQTVLEDVRNRIAYKANHLIRLAGTNVDVTGRSLLSKAIILNQIIVYTSLKKRKRRTVGYYAQPLSNDSQNKPISLIKSLLTLRANACMKSTQWCFCKTMLNKIYKRSLSIVNFGPLFVNLFATFTSDTPS